MIPFTLHNPMTLAEALDLLERYGEDARPIAGGTALVLLMQQRLVRPEHLVNLARIKELSTIETNNGALRVGASVHHRTLEKNPQAQEGWPLLTYTYRRAGPPWIRHAGPIGRRPRPAP